MRPTRVLLGVLLCLGGARAEKPASPLRFVPDQSDLVAQVPGSARLLDTVTALDVVQQIQGFESVKELLDSTQTRRFRQMLAYFEKELGADTKTLLDRLAGGGAVLAVKFGDKAPALLV